MQTYFIRSGDVPPSSGIPLAARQAVLEQQAAEDNARLKRLGKRAARVEQIAKEHRDALQALFGAKRYKDFRAFIAEARHMQAERLLTSEGPETLDEEIERVSAERRDAGIGRLEKLKIDVERLRAVNQATARRLERLLDRPAPMRNGEPAVLLASDDVPAEVRRSTGNPWSVRKPPYDGWHSTIEGWNDGFVFTPTLYLDAAAGLVGYSNSLVDSDAGDWDGAAKECSSWVGFWYKTPSAGLVEAWIEAQCGSAHHHLSLENEYGWSDSTVRQENHLMFKVDGGKTGDWNYTLTSWWKESGHTDGSWDKHYVANGYTYWAHVFSDLAFPANTWVYVQIGTMTYNFALVDDVETDSEARFKWFIKSVTLHSTG